MIQFDTHLFRGPRPPSMQWLKDNGFNKVINLQSGTFEFFHQDAYESQKGFDFGIDEKCFFWSDIFAPRVHSLRHIATLLDIWNNHGVKSYIHCLHGKDRTGMAVAAYNIMYKNMSVGLASKQMFDAGFHKRPYLIPLNWPAQLWRLK